MKPPANWLLALGAVLLVLTCRDSRASTFADYMPHATGDHLAGMLVRQDGGEWYSQWVAYGGGQLEWRDPHGAPGSGSFEYMSVHNGWVYLDRLDDHAIKCAAAEIEDVESGRISSIDCSFGHPYVPLLIPRSKFYVRVWGDVSGQPFYWQSLFTPGVTPTGGCYYQPVNTITDAIEQQDSWWAKYSGWVRATGTLPFDAVGRPVRPSVTNHYAVTLAKGYGVWTINDNGNRLCLYSQWRW